MWSCKLYVECLTEPSRALAGLRQEWSVAQTSVRRSVRRGVRLFRARPLGAREEVRHANQVVPLQSGKQPHVLEREGGPPPVDGVIHLPEQILVVLASEARDQPGVVSLPCRAMARCAALRVKACAAVNAVTATHAPRPIARKLACIGRNARDVMRVTQHVSGDVLHADVPAGGVAIVDELSDENAEVLARASGK